MHAASAATAGLGFTGRFRVPFTGAEGVSHHDPRDGPLHAVDGPPPDEHGRGDVHDRGAGGSTDGEAVPDDSRQDHQP